MTARPDPMNRGDSPPTAIRVNTTVNENAKTPSSPQSTPLREADVAADTGETAPVS